MAPATNIGAATPIASDGQDIPDDLGAKVMNDTIATITSIAEERGRPVEWAVATVDEARSYTVDEALAAGAIDFKAESIADLLAQADGMTVDVAGVATVLETEGAVLDELAMNPFQSFLHLLSDPNIAFILFTLGFYGIFFELQNPNYVTGILGAFAIVLAFIGFGSLPLNVAGLLLIGLAVILFVLEFSVISGGLLTVGGLVGLRRWARRRCTPSPAIPVAPSVSVAPDGDRPHDRPHRPVVIGWSTRSSMRRAEPAAGSALSTSTKPTRAYRHPGRGPRTAAARSASSTLAGEEWTPARPTASRSPSGARRSASSATMASRSSSSRWTARATDQITRRSHRPDMDLCSSAAIAIVVLLLRRAVAVILYLVVRIVRQYERMVIFRLGKTDDALVKGAGPACSSSRSSTGPSRSTSASSSSRCPSQTAITTDNAPITIDFLIYWRIIDPLKSVVNVARLRRRARRHRHDDLRAVVGDILLDDVLSQARPDQRGPAHQARREHRALGRQGHHASRSARSPRRATCRIR